jgi:hypothetical protein
MVKAFNIIILNEKGKKEILKVVRLLNTLDYSQIFQKVFLLRDTFNRSEEIDFFYPSGVIVFGSDQEVAELMKAVKRMNATGHFNWIGSDGWSARALVSDGNYAS